MYDKIFETDDEDWALNNGVYVSKIPLRTKIEVLGPDEPVLDPFDHDDIVITPNHKIGRRDRVKKIGFMIPETIGIVIVNTRAISKLRMNKEDSDV